MPVDRARRRLRNGCGLDDAGRHRRRILEALVGETSAASPAVEVDREEIGEIDGACLPRDPQARVLPSAATAFSLSERRATRARRWTIIQEFPRRDRHRKIF